MHDTMKMKLLGCVFLGMRILALAQTSGTGALTGTVVDTTGAIVRDAHVVVTSESTGEARAVVSQDNGGYSVPLLLPGSYRVEASRSGFKQSVKSGLRVTVTETARLDIRLEPGAPQDSIEVRTEAELLQTESTSLGRVTDRALVTNLPLATRNYTQIIALSPGIMAEVTSAAELGPGSGGYSGGIFWAHGAAGRDNNFQMNGVQINDLQTTGIFSGSVAIPSPDAIEEFKVQTGLYDASFGRNAGASVNVVTRGGSNRFHGTAFEFLRNEALNANEFFRNAAGQPRGVLRQNQFGGTLGGPIRRDKLLFFVSYQGTRQRNGLGGGSTSNFFMPALTSDRSRVALGALFAGQRGFYQEQDGGVGPAVAADGSNISPQAFALLNRKLPNGEFVIPTPHRVDPARSFATRGFAAFSVPAPFAENQFIANLDLLHTARSKLVGRFFYAESDLERPLPATNIGGPPAPGFPFRSPSNLRNLSLGHGYSFGPTVFNQADFGFHRIFVPTVQEEPFKWSDVGVRAPSHADPYPALAIQGSLTLGGNGQGLNTAQNHFTFQDAVTVVRGRHTLRIGGGLTRSQINRTGVHYYSGLVFFSWPDFLLGLPAGDPAGGGNGTRFSSIYTSLDLPGLFDRGWRILDANAYIQEDLRLTSTLVLNLGARYERLGHFGDIHGRNSGFDIALADPDPPAAGTLAGFLVSKNFQGAVPAGVTRLDNTFGIRGAHQNNFDPRVGLAWQLPRTALPFTGRMVLRGGFGIYHTRATGQPFLQSVINPPFGVIRSLEGEANGRATFADPFQGEMTFPQFTPYSPTSQRSVTTVDPDYRPPVTEQYSANLQADLGHDLLLEVGYVGTRGWHQILGHSLNQARSASPSSPVRGETTNTVANVAKRVRIPGFQPAGIWDVDSSARSRYDGLETSLTRRFSKGLQFLAGYTLGRAFSTAGMNTTAGGGGVYGDQEDPRSNYGPNNFHREHRLVASFLYELPEPRRFGRTVGLTLGGWALAGVVTLQSGRPLTLIGTNANNAFGTTTDRAQLAGGCTYRDLVTPGPVTARLNNYFNKSCIARNASGRAAWPVIGADGIATGFGNSGVGIVTGPGQRNLDLALMKRTTLKMLGEGGGVELRAEFFNALNTPQFADPNTGILQSTFGVISATAVNPRIVQLALKVAF